MSHVSHHGPDDGGIGDMLGRRMAQERIADAWGCDPGDVQVDYPAPLDWIGDPDDLVGLTLRRAHQGFRDRADESYRLIADGPPDDRPPTA